MYNNHYEAFNHLHSSLRSVIERSFGVWKAKFKIMDQMPVNISFPDQVALVPAMMAIHNFIRLRDQDDDDFVDAERNSQDHGRDPNGNNGDYHVGGFQQSDDAMNKLRDDICTSITFSWMGLHVR